MCTKCAEANDSECIYDKPASIAYVRHLEKQLRDLSKSQGSGGKEGEIQKKNDKAHDDDLKGSNNSTAREPPGSDSERNSKTEPSPSSSSQKDQQPKPKFTKPRIEKIFTNAKYVGSTSEYRKFYLDNFDKKARELEDTALKTALQTTFSYISLATAQQCLLAYWSWIHPIYITTHRASFVHDMASYSPASPYRQNSSFSLALLSSMIADALPLFYRKDNEIIKIVTQHSHALLNQEILFPPSLGTVMAALHLSIRAMKDGNISQCWTLSGIAYRLAADINLTLAPQNLDSDISIENVEARNRAGWALFYWDQNISLFLGRLPTLNQVPLSFNEGIIDCSADKDLWNPVIEPKGNPALSSELIKLAGLDINKSNSRRPSFKRSASGSIKSESSAAKRKTLDEEISNEANQNDMLQQSNFTLVMKYKIKVFEIENQATSFVFGKNFNSLSSTNVDFFTPAFFLNNEQAQQLSKCISDLSQQWKDFPDCLKVNEIIALPAGIHLTPAIISGCLQHFAISALIYNYLLYFHNTSNPHSTNIDSSSGILSKSKVIQYGLDCVVNVIKVLSVYINYYGNLKIDHWDEYAPFVCACFIISLVNLNQLSERKQHEKAIGFLKILFRFLLNPVFKSPNSIAIITKIKVILMKHSPHILQSQHPNLAITSQLGSHLRSPIQPQFQKPPDLAQQHTVYSNLINPHLFRDQQHTIGSSSQSSNQQTIVSQSPATSQSSQNSPHSLIQVNQSLAPPFDSVQSSTAHQPTPSPHKTQSHHHAHSLSGSEMSLLSLDSVPKPANVNTSSPKKHTLSATHSAQNNFSQPSNTVPVSFTYPNQPSISSLSARTSASFSHELNTSFAESSGHSNISPDTTFMNTSFLTQGPSPVYQSSGLLPYRGPVVSYSSYSNAYALTSSGSPVHPTQPAIFQGSVPVQPTSMAMPRKQESFGNTIQTSQHFQMNFNSDYRMSQQIIPDDGVSQYNSGDTQEQNKAHGYMIQVGTISNTTETGKEILENSNIQNQSQHNLSSMNDSKTT